MLHRASAIARIAVFAGAVCCAFGQVPAVIQIDIANYAYYYADNPDYSKLAGSQQAVAPVSTKTFSSFIGLADIVQVNGKPAKGGRARRFPGSWIAALENWCLFG